MSVMLVIASLVLAFLGLNLALVAWVVLRLAIGSIAASIGFNLTLAITVWGLVSLIP